MKLKNLKGEEDIRSGDGAPEQRYRHWQRQPRLKPLAHLLKGVCQNYQQNKQENRQDRINTAFSPAALISDHVYQHEQR